jgi:uncharacterized protein YaaN involved in tellurite resistance
METLTLTAPDPVRAIATEQTRGQVDLSPEARGRVETSVTRYVDALLSLTTGSPAFKEKVEGLSAFGQKAIREASSQSNRFLDRPTGRMEGGVGADLIRLRGIVEDLDPGRNRVLEPRRLLGIIPFGSRIQAYFRRYQSSQTHIAAILKALAAGKDELLMDNATIDGERRRLWESMGRLEEAAQTMRLLDDRLEEVAARLDVTDPEKARAIRENALFTTRQRTQDLMTQLAVTMQGYLALDLIKKNNIELIKGVDRASTTTVSALKTAIIVAQALGAQRLVLEQVTALNSTTAGIIDGTSRLMRDQSARINEQASSTTIPVETLQRAFQNIYETMDSIDAFKLKALDSMRTTIDALDAETGKAARRLAQSERRGGSDMLALPS